MYCSFLFYLIIYFSGDIMSKESFKIFAKSHPELVSRVMSNEVSWQNLYELYDIYGDNSEIWSKYISNTVSNVAKSDLSFKEVFNSIKNVDMNSLQKGIENLQKTVGLLQDIGIGGGGASSAVAPKGYEPKPLYRHLED